jgi:xanthine dehydrogenase YagT iron-sulfur-binding subunit
LTIEGLSKVEKLHPMQQAFIRHDAFQCGYCTPGQILAAVALLSEGRATSDADIREFMSGNLCRCGAYPNIVAAIRDVAEGGSNASL